MKLCNVCKTVKPLSCFRKHSSGRFGVRAYCEKCRPPEKRRNRRESKLKDKYGITQIDFETMAARQGHRCAICGIRKFLQEFHVDHCHATNRVRGLLCGKCNRGLGLFEDNPIIIKNALAYLEAS